MSDAIRELHDYLAKSPSVIYPEDVLAYLPAIENESAALRTQLADVTESMGRVEERCAKLRELAEKAWKTAEMLCQAWEGPCHADGVPIKPPCPLGERDELCVYGLIQRDLHELGVEVP